MKIKLEEIINAAKVLEKIDRTNFDIKLSYKLNKILTKLINESRDFNKARDEAIVKNGAEDEKTHQFRVTPENIEKFQKEIEALLAEEIELDVWQISLSSLDGKIQLSPAELRMLGKFLIDDLDKVPEPTSKPLDGKSYA
jgi:hypothetical protein